MPRMSDVEDAAVAMDTLDIPSCLFAVQYVAADITSLRPWRRPWMTRVVGVEAYLSLFFFFQESDSIGLLIRIVLNDGINIEILCSIHRLRTMNWTAEPSTLRIMILMFVVAGTWKCKKSRVKPGQIGDHFGTELWTQKGVRALRTTKNNHVKSRG